MSYRKIAVVVATLFVVQLVTYLFGAQLIQRFESGDAARDSLTLGVLLTTSSGVAIVGIGLLMYQVLKDVDRRLAIWYPVLRVVEFTVSTAFGTYLLAQEQAVPHHHLWVYIPTGIGGLVLTYLLLVSRLVPRAVATLGVIGYASLLLAVPLDLFGAIDTNEGAGLAILTPGLLFEVVVFPVWLLVRGFNRPAAAAAHSTPAFATTT